MLLPDFGATVAAADVFTLHLVATFPSPKFFPYESDCLLSITGVPHIRQMTPRLTALTTTPHLLTIEIPGRQLRSAYQLLRVLESDGCTFYPRLDQSYRDSAGCLVVPLCLEATPCQSENRLTFTNS